MNINDGFDFRHSAYCSPNNTKMLVYCHTHQLFVQPNANKFKIFNYNQIFKTQKNSVYYENYLLSQHTQN